MMAFVLLIGMAQCKKEQVTPSENNGVNITLKVDGGSEKLNVYPATGAVIFTAGDEIYVGNNGKYVGTLTFENGLFQGTVSGDLSTDDYLHFYFVGNKPTSPSTLAAGTATYTVDISDQSTGLPAISYAPSTAKYSPSTTAYTAKLLNKSALVKFVPSTATSQPITVSGLNNKVQIDFASHTLAPTGNTGGITLFSAGESEKWAVLLEQASLSGLTVSVDGYNSTIDGTTLPSAITNNMYYNTGIGISMTATYQTFVVTSSSSDPSVGSFNAAASIPTPKLCFETDYGDGLTITRANGIVDFNGHSANELFIQNDVEGESITFQNGTIDPKPIDGASGIVDSYQGTVILENMTVNNRIYTDGHAYVINSGTYYSVQNDYRTGYPSTVVINGGKFREFYNTTGQYTIYGGKYSFNPSNSNNVTIPSGYSVKSNTDPDSGTYPWVVTALPEGALRGEFTINGSGDKVFFSQGNLQYQASTSTWRFAEHQYDYVGNASNGNVYVDEVKCNNANISSTYTGWIDLFGWGTSGYNHGGANCYQPWSTSTDDSHYYAYGYASYNLYDQNGQADWGYNAISNGGNLENSSWRTLTIAEWGYVINTRNGAVSKKGHGNVNGVNGIILLPDAWTLPDGLSFTSGNSSWVNVYNGEQWAQMEANGAVFLPAAGCRNGGPSGSVVYVGNTGYYWSASCYESYSAYRVSFGDSSLDPQARSYRYGGQSVRLVRNVE